MDIGREGPQWRPEEALPWIQFCLRKIEEADGHLQLYGEVVPGCTLEEITGALLYAEHELTREE